MPVWEPTPPDDDIATPDCASNKFTASNTFVLTQFNNLTRLAQANNIISDNAVNTAIINVSSNTGIRGAVGSAPSSNNTATEGVPVGTIFFSNNHLYIATDATTIKRVSLEVFS